MSMALYKIADEVNQVLVHAGEDGELGPELAAKLDALALAFEDKAKAIVQYRAGIEATKHAVKMEAARLALVGKQLEDRSEWLKSYLMDNMIKAGVPKLDLGTHKVWLQKNGRPSISYNGDIPAEYRLVTVTESFDSQAAYEAWKAGEALPESIVVSVGQHLRIS